ncbi:MAG: acyl-CoA reductase [Bacteroidota bacterium]|nr:acyl-CoA reductase [Bacteroidota bacterium]
MTKQDIIKIYQQLGVELSNVDEFLIHKANTHNQWFTPENIMTAINHWAKTLTSEHVSLWLSDYQTQVSDKKVGIIMAGNIPLVGLHDLLCVVASGKTAVIKPSSQDEVLIKHIVMLLQTIDDRLINKIIITESLKGIDFLIATGSNNSARYFEYYFKEIPKIIRKNRTSVAVLTGNETENELTALADDIYTYFGLGCRNVTHLLLPKDFQLKRLYEAYDKYIDIVHHNKYYNNYMYHKSILLMNLTKHYDNGFMLFQEKEEPHAPIATLNYHYYNDIEDAKAYINQHEELWQCVVCHKKINEEVIPFGKSQQPNLWDYADNVNVLDFLNTI